MVNLNYTILPYNNKIIFKNGKYYGVIKEFGRDTLIEADSYVDALYLLEDVKEEYINSLLESDEVISLPENISLEEAFSLSAITNSRLFKAFSNMIKNPLSTVKKVYTNKQILSNYSKMYKKIAADPMGFIDDQIETFTNKFQKEIEIVKDKSGTTFNPYQYAKEVYKILTRYINPEHNFIKDIFNVLYTISEVVVQIALYITTGGHYGMKAEDLKKLNEKVKEIEKVFKDVEDVKLNKEGYEKIVDPSNPWWKRVPKTVLFHISSKSKVIGLLFRNLITSGVLFVLAKPAIMLVLKLFLVIVGLFVSWLIPMLYVAIFAGIAYFFYQSQNAGLNPNIGGGGSRKGGSSRKKSHGFVITPSP